MKTYDLTPDAELTPGIGMLFSMVTYNFNRLKRHLNGLTQNEIDFKGPANDMNSIAQLLRHLTVTDLHWVFRLQSMEMPRHWIDKYGPMYDDDGKIPFIRNVPLETLFSEYDEVQEMLRTVLLQKNDGDLDRPVPFENGNYATIRWSIWHMADHSRHHFSNMVYLKKLQRQRPVL